MFATRLLVAAPKELSPTSLPSRRPGKEVPAGANRRLDLDGLTSAFHGRGFSRDGDRVRRIRRIEGTFAFTYNAFRRCFASEDARVGEAAIVASRTFPCASFASIK
jgi:hypothetical protein